MNYCKNCKYWKLTYSVNNSIAKIGECSNKKIKWMFRRVFFFGTMDIQTCKWWESKNDHKI